MSSPARKSLAQLGKLTIVQISDVHLGLIVRKERLDAMLDKVKAGRRPISLSQPGTWWMVRSTVWRDWRNFCGK